MPHGLTPQQRNALNFIRLYFQEHDGPPSYREITDYLGLRSVSGTLRLVNALEERGHITRLPYQRRSIALVERSISFEPQPALPLAVDLELRLYCKRHAENPSDVLADAVRLFLDERERDEAVELRELEPVS